jgi:hypothetical protein
MTKLKMFRAAAFVSTGAVFGAWLAFPRYEVRPLDGCLIVAVVGGVCGLGIEQLVQRIERSSKRFSLRMLFVATTLIALLLGRIAWMSRAS